MSIFPQQTGSIYNDKDTDVTRILDKFYGDTISINQTFWEQADIDARFEAGDQEVFKEVFNDLTPNRLASFSFNRIRRIVNMISGYQRRNRKSTIIVPVENGDEVTSDQYTKIIMWLNQQEGILDTISQGFHGSIVTGMSLLQTWVDYRTDPISGNIKVNYCPYNTFLIDPYFKKTDLTDCNAIWKRSFLTKRACKSLMPKKKELIEQMITGTTDGRFQFLPENYDLKTSNLLAYDEYYYRAYRKQKMLIDSSTGEVTEWSFESKDGLSEFLSMYPQITLVEQEVPTVKLIVLIQGKVVYDGANPSGIDKYPFVPIMSYFRPELSEYSLKIQGVVRGLRDAQFLYNRRKRIELDILESQVNSGWIYKENTLVDPKSIFMSGQGRGLALKATASMSDLRQITPPQIPPSLFQLSEGLANEINQISGVNEELLGSATDEKAGILSMLRQGAGLTTLQTLFDQLDRAQKLLGSILLETIQANFSPAKVKKIIEQDPAPQFYKKAFGKYDAAVEEGLNTTTQKQMQFAQLLQLRESGISIPDSVLIDAVSIQNKKELKDTIEQLNQQQQQQQQQEAQSAMQEQEARTELTKARALADRGLGVERISRIKENQALAVERRAEARKDNDMAFLNVVKAIKELDDIDLSQIQKMILLASQIRKSETEIQSPSSSGQDPGPSIPQREFDSLRGRQTIKE